jgi:hypothetical protein
VRPPRCALLRPRNRGGFQKERVMGVPFKGKINVDIRDWVPDWSPFEPPKAPPPPTERRASWAS